MFKGRVADDPIDDIRDSDLTMMRIRHHKLAELANHLYHMISMTSKQIMQLAAWPLSSSFVAAFVAAFRVSLFKRLLYRDWITFS